MNKKADVKVSFDMMSTEDSIQWELKIINVYFKDACLINIHSFFSIQNFFLLLSTPCIGTTMYIELTLE